MQIQPGDTPPPVMSFFGFRGRAPAAGKLLHHSTNERTHDIIRANLDRSPMYAGIIEGIGPRYCPSIEDKINRFADKTSHQIFLEPEGLNSTELYPNGISTSPPLTLQLDLIHSISGLENAHVTRPGYAIEYDYFDPQDLRHSLETKFVHNLSLLAKSTAPQATKKRALRVCLRALMRIARERPRCLDAAS